MFIKLLLFLGFLFFRDNPSITFLFSSIFVFLIILDIRQEISRGFLPLIQVLFLKFFIEQSFAMTLLEVMNDYFGNIEMEYIRAVPYEDINLLVLLSCLGIYTGFNAFFNQKKVISIRNVNFLKFKVRPVITLFLLISLLRFLKIPALDFPLYVIDYLFTVFLIVNVALNLNFYNPLLYLLLFDVAASMNSGMIGSGLFYIILAVLLFISINSMKAKNKLSRYIAFIVLVSPFFVYFIAILQTVKFEVRKSWDDASVEKQNIYLLAYNEMIDRQYPLEVYYVALLSRLNQASLVSKTMVRVPKYLPYEYGSTILRSLTDAFTFRFLNQDKEKSGGREKFEKYTGHALIGYTSMNIGIIGESYVNFGSHFSFIFNVAVGILLAFFLASITTLFRGLNEIYVVIFKVTVCAIIFDSLSDYQMFLNTIVKTFVIFLALSFVIKYLSIPNARRAVPAS